MSASAVARIPRNSRVISFSRQLTFPLEPTRSSPRIPPTRGPARGRTDGAEQYILLSWPDLDRDRPPGQEPPLRERHGEVDVDHEGREHQNAREHTGDVERSLRLQDQI